jgi:opacity protein-like surface antigen
MKLISSAALVSVITVLAASTSSAQVEDVYVSGSLGASFASDVEFEGVQAPEAGIPGVPGAPASVGADFDTDLTYSVAIGASWPERYSFGPLKPRSEIELNFFEADVDGGEFNGGNQVFGGDLSATSLFVNSYFDIQFDPNARLVPYIGGGFGLSDVDANITYFPNNGVANAPTFAVQGGGTELASHFTGGMTLKANDKIDIFAQARYLTIYEADAERRFIAGGADGFSAAVEDTINGFDLSTGLRFKF